MSSVKMKIYLSLLYISLKFVTIECANILAVFPTPSISHQIVFRPLVLELIRRGHVVTVITTDPVYPKGEAPANLSEIDVHDLSYRIWRDAVLKEKSGSEGDILTQVEVIMKSMIKVFEAQISTKDVQDIVHKKRGQFDLLLLEAYFKPALIFSHIYKVPVIQISSFGGLRHNYEVVGAPIHPLLYPTPGHQRLYNLTLWEKIYQLYKHWQLENILDQSAKDYDLALRNITCQKIPSLAELTNNVHMLFLNIHPIWIDNQPVPSNVVFIGGITKSLPKELPMDLQKFLNASNNGVVYFSLGTNVRPSLLPPNKIQIIVKVFSELPYGVVVKWDRDTIPGQTDNMRTYKWLPQSDLLRHPNIKLFITQGGLQSTEEAINNGVPLIGIPMLADQWYNSEKYVYHKIGIKLDMPSLEESEFRQAIETIIKDKSYRDNIKKLRAIFEDDLQSALERAVWWTEYVLRHGGAKHLKAAGANITWTEYLELELSSLLLLILFSTLILIYTVLILLSRIIFAASKMKKS